jgi:hypothetical protein
MAREVKRLIHPGCGSDDLAAEVMDHVLDQHCDHCIVLDDEHAASRLVGHDFLRSWARKVQSLTVQPSLCSSVISTMRGTPSRPVGLNF